MNAPATQFDGNVFVRAIPCLHCGYDLRNIRVSGVCPECGKAAGDALHGVAAALPEDVEEVRSGLRILQLSSALGPLIAGGTMIVMALGAGGSEPESLLVCAGIIACVGLPAMTLGGVNLLFKPLRPGVPPTSPPPCREWAMGKVPQRMAVWHLIVSAVWLVCVMVLSNARGRSGDGLLFVVFSLLWASGMLWTGKNALACVRMSEIAGRSNGRRLAMWMMVMAWIAGVMMVGVVLAGAIALLMFVIESGGLRFIEFREFLQPLIWVIQMIGPFLGFGSLAGWALAWPISIGLVRRRVGSAWRAVPPGEGPLVRRVEREAGESAGVAPAQGQNPQAPSPPVL